MFQSTKLVLLAAAIIGGALSVQHSGIRVSTRAEDCSGFMFSKCELDLDGVLSALPSDNPEFCQMTCNEVFEGLCNVFHYSHNDSICSILSQNVEDHIRTCREVGGTPLPSTEHCFSQTDPCYFFHDEDCTMVYNATANLQNVESVSKCQRSCQLYSGCRYFVFDLDTKRCQLFDVEEKTCSVTVGPSSPSYEECKAQQTTTSPPTTAIPNPCVSSPYNKTLGGQWCTFTLNFGYNTYKEASDTCKLYGGRLPEIYSAEENIPIFETMSVGTNIWLGATDLAEEDTWVWETTGFLVNNYYNNFYPNQPNSGEVSNCLAMGYGSGEWHDWHCDQGIEGRFEVLVCEKKLEE